MITVNGVDHEIALGTERSLLHVLREELGLTGAKPGCGEGVCGACTVLLDDEPVRSCRVWVAAAEGRTVTTIEGLAAGGRLHPVQQAFRDEGAFQCGYCTPGMVMATTALLASDPKPDDAAIRAALAVNVCRCCTYPRILRAVRRAAGLISGGGGPDAPPRAAESQGATLDLGRPRRPWDTAPAAERDYFDVLPDGLVVVLEPDPGGSGAWTTSAGAWIHVAGDGTVTAFSGKVDVGQDNRTALALRVAEELQIPLASVSLVMGDTDLCPYDMGTFGSRSMPDAAEQLRRAAAATREAIIDLAAARWGVAPARLRAWEGRIVETAAERAAGYGEFVTGQRLVRIGAPGAALTPGLQERLVGQPTARIGATEIVTGAKRFPSDLARPGMLHGRVLRPPAFGARLRSAKLAEARAVPRAVVVRAGSFIGVAAPDPFIASRALKAIEARWDLPAGPSEAGLDGHLRAHPVDEEGWEGGFHDETGDPDAALAAAPVRLAATYTTAYIAHVPMETHVALAEWDAADHLTVWTGTQVPFGVREELAMALEVPEERIRVIVPGSGGGFGGKHAGAVALEAARLARASGRPVKVRWNRGEEFSAGYLRPAAVIDVCSGASAEGRIEAWEMRNINSGRFGIVGPYEIPNQRLVYQPAESPLAQGSYRALAATANHFARESHMDELAHALGADPLELRLRHLADERLVAVLRAAAARAGWARRPHGGGTGMGIACGVEKGARVATCAEVRVGEGGQLEVLRLVTAFECGAIVNPDGLANQVEGATVMGLGGALFEAIHFEQGRILNGSLTDYRVPRLADVPALEVVLLDRRDVPSAGAGETPIIAVAPALANAIFAGSGVRLRSLPLAPEGVVRG